MVFFCLEGSSQLLRQPVYAGEAGEAKDKVLRWLGSLRNPSVFRTQEMSEGELETILRPHTIRDSLISPDRETYIEILERRAAFAKQRSARAVHTIIGDSYPAAIG